MKRLWISVVLITLSVSASNTQGAFHSFNKSNKIFIITLDGFRWQEVFQGADSLLINDPKSTGDTAFIKALYWSTDLVERRKKLLPFFWNVVDREGQLFGNRQYQNKVNVSNPYALSYPGYNEILTGSVDLSILNNARKKNTNTNILEWLNGSGAYAGKVAAFTSWDMFPFILGKGGFYLDTGREHNGQGASASEKFQGALTMPLTKETTETRYDELTFRACREYVEKQKPSVVFLSFSGTDNAGHAGQYGDYLQQAHAADRMISELWQLVQSLPEYAGKTTLLITTDHGRGSKARNWTTHGFFVGGSSQTWFSLLGNGVVPKGEMKGENQAYQKDFRQLITQYLCKN